MLPHYNSLMKEFRFYLIILSVLTVQACKKQDAGEVTCQQIQNATITYKSPVTIGDEIKFEAPDIDGYRVYNWNGPNSYSNQSPQNYIQYAELKNEGWYYLNIFSSDGNCQKIDSFYLDVKLEQGTPTCTQTTNTTNYSNLGQDAYTSVTKYIEPNFSQKALLCYGAGTNMTVYFHTHWRTAEPEDGIYYTQNIPVFDQADNNYNKVFITTTKQSIYWSSNSDQKVYISHVGSKLQIRFCNLSMSGNNGSNYTTIATGNLQEK